MNSRGGLRDPSMAGDVRRAHLCSEVVNPDWVTRSGSDPVTRRTLWESCRLGKGVVDLGLDITPGAEVSGSAEGVFDASTDSG